MINRDSPIVAQLIGMFVALDVLYPGILSEIRELTREVEAARPPRLELVRGPDLDRSDLN